MIAVNKTHSTYESFELATSFLEEIESNKIKEIKSINENLEALNDINKNILETLASIDKRQEDVVRSAQTIVSVVAIFLIIWVADNLWGFFA